jgi:hypothetical protein
MFTSNGCTEPHFNNAGLERAIACFQAQGDVQSLSEIVRLVQPRAETLIRFYKTSHYRPEDELLSDINHKLLRSVTQFDPAKGSAFTYVSKIIDSSLRTSVSTQRRNWQRHCELSDELANSLHAAVDDRSTADELAHKIRAGAKTMLTDRREIEAQRWLIDSFCQDGFHFRRCQCADAAMGTFQLSHARSRELYDLTMLEVRRALYDDVQHEPISPGRLLGTRAHWMAQYQSLLSADEFVKFFVLMRNLAPYLLLLIIDPTKANNHRADRNPAIGHQNLELILYGCPGARPLFSHLSRLRL